MSMHDLQYPPGRTYRYNRNPLFPMGYGLSLTTWSLTGTAPACLSTLATSSANTVCTVSLKLENTGKMDGDSVVLAYFTQDNVKAAAPGLLTPLRELFDYQRVTVASGASTTLTFNVSAAVLATYAEATGDLVATPDSYTLTFHDGGPSTVQLSASVHGDAHVIEPFPSST